MDKIHSDVTHLFTYILELLCKVDNDCLCQSKMFKQYLRALFNKP